ncbi:hypothetical protein V6U78_11185 [Marinospirillum sp. MEB164]|uniref:PDZ domain-containing protein n=1 Tax=Marinospirillum alkalitolerans TaxID=3123374 RepID=A0ABW8Q0L1_9GAMM
MELIFFIWVLCGVVAAFIASLKGVSILGWFFLGVLFGPLSWLFLAVKTSEEKPDNMIDERTRICPYCAESVKKDAKVCRYCSRDLPDRIMGLHVDAVREGEAKIKGVRVGDVIYKIADKYVIDNSVLKQCMNDLEGQEVNLLIARDSHVVNIFIKAGPLGVSCSELEIDKPFGSDN